MRERTDQKEPGQATYLVFKKTLVRFHIKIVKVTGFPQDCKKSSFMDLNLIKHLVIFQGLEMSLVGSHRDQW